MRVRKAILVVALAATLSACTGDGDSERPSDPLTEITVDCDEFADTTQRIVDAQVALYSDTGGTQAIDTLVAELEALEEDAPDDVRTALRNMSDGFRQAEELLDNPTRKNKAKLRELAPKLAADGQTITAYITSECG